MSNTPDTPSSNYALMASKWGLIDALLGGTQRMRQECKTWLPQESAESPKAYEARVARTILYAAFEDTVDKYVSKPFSRAVMVSELPESTDPRIAGLNIDADGCGQPITPFAAGLFRDMCTYGLTHILVDFSRAPDVGRPLTLEEEKRLNLRPRFIHISPQSLIGWRFSEAQLGVVQTELESIRIKETCTEQDGEYGEKQVVYIHEYTKTEWRKWAQDPEDAKWVVVDSGPNTLGRIPLVTAYTRKIRPLVAYPPFEKLAWLNLAHYQSYSDQRNILRFSRFAFLFAKGLTDDQVEKGITIGPTNCFATTSTDADMRMVEHSGSAIGAGRQDLLDLEARMEILGLQPAVDSSAQQTATGKAIDDRNGTSMVQQWIANLELALEAAYATAAEWVKTPLPDKFTVDVFSDFKIESSTVDEMRLIVELNATGKVTDEDMMVELTRRGLFKSENMVANLDAARNQFEDGNFDDETLPKGAGYDSLPKKQSPLARPT